MSQLLSGTEIDAEPPLRAGGFRMVLISALAAMIGMLAGVIAYLLLNLIGFFTNLFFYQRIAFTFVSPQNNQLGPWVIAVPILGALVVGVMAKYGSPRIKGHGIPEAIEAVVFNRSRIEPRVAILKPLSAAIAIGTGGPFGAEGPIIQTGGAVGSLIGQAIHTTAAERKVLLACGAAAGMSATFNTPIAGVIMAIELLLFEFKSRSFIPLVIASVLATATRFMLMGRGAMFQINPLDFGVPDQLPYYLVLGALCGLAAVGLTKALYFVEDLFASLPIPEILRPASGAVILGLAGFFVPRILGVGYDTISDILNDRLALGLLAAIMVIKVGAMVISLGSETSGGLLAPTFMGSAALGALFAHAINLVVPGAHLSPGAYALIAMGAVFGAASRATFTFIIFAFEITHDYNAILPLMLVSVIADGIALALMPESSIMTEKLARRGLRVQQEYEADMLRQVTVGEVMATKPPIIPASMTVDELADLIARHDPQLEGHQVAFIVNREGGLAAVITRSDVLKALERQEGNRAVLDVGSTHIVVTYPDEMVFDALSKLMANDIGRLPVVERAKPDRVIGYLGRAGVLLAWGRRLEEEHIREPGLLQRPAS